MSTSSSWFTNFSLPPNLTNQLSNLSTSILQATSKVGAVANNMVQKSMPTSKENDQSTTESNKDFSSVLNDFGATVMKSAQQLKEAVERKSPLGNFSKEQERFLTEKRTQQKREETALPPWSANTEQEEEELKSQILALSQEKRHFLRSPPPGADFHFDMASTYPVALVVLEVDENLKQMRFDLVPKQVNEESFWRNYFYRVSLIKQSAQLSALAQSQGKLVSSSSSPVSAAERRTSDNQEAMSDINQEFVSEDYDTSAINLDDIRREIEQLGIHPKKDLDDSEWDKALSDELENVSAEELEAQINEMLNGDFK